MSANDYRKYLSGEGALAYQRAQDEAAADNVFGVPLFFFEGEPFLEARPHPDSREAPRRLRADYRALVEDSIDAAAMPFALAGWAA
jgi:hypothetical protein